ncbi:MAG TPA: alpha/beta hydrolase [Pseudomonadales bacterium]
MAGSASGADPDAAGSLPVPELAEPRFEDCELHGSDGTGRAAAECARVSVPENPAEPDGRQIELFVARVPALTPEPLPDAVTIVNGGPGGSSVSLYVDLRGAFDALRRDRDIVVVDQRGTGRSSALECPTLETATYDFDIELVRRGTRACLDAIDADPRFYTTSVAVTDLEAVRRALGYQSWNLYGVSYGTRVAQHYLQRFPQAVRTLIIDGVIPLGAALGPDVAPNAQRTLDAILARCEAVGYCADAFPHLRGELTRLSAQLRDQPVALTIPHPVTGRKRELELHYAQLAMSLRLLSYAPETAALIPLIVHEAAERENYLPLASQALAIEESLLSSISFGMHNSVVCSEDVPFYGDLDALWAELEDTYLGTTQVRALLAICEIWPRGLMHPALREPLQSSKPVLLLSGEYDPITPPRYAEQAAEGLSNARHLVAPGQGHGVVARGCVPYLVSDFVAAGRLDGLETDCVDRLASDAFFVDLLGPPP